MKRRSFGTLGLAVTVLLAGCGSGSPEAARPTVAPTTVPTATAPMAPAAASTPTPEPTPAVQVADFKVVAYQGDVTFGGHDGHFAPAFAADRPVVLLYFGGL